MPVNWGKPATISVEIIIRQVYICGKLVEKLKSFSTR
jgi:hypothetical protein